MATIDVALNMAQTGRRITTEVTIKRPISVNELLKHVNEKAKQQCHVIIDGNSLDRDDWDKRNIKNTSVVQIMPQVHGGDDSNTVAVVLTIAILISAPHLSSALQPIVGAEFAAGISAVAATGGILLVNHLFPPRTPDDPGANEEQNYTLSAGSNTIRKHQSATIVFGKHRVFPEFAGLPYAEISEASTADVNPTVPVISERQREYLDVDEGVIGHSDTVFDSTGAAVGRNIQILNQLFDWGLGDIKITDKRLGETPLSEFEDVQTQITTPITLVDSNVDTAEGLVFDFDNNRFTTRLPPNTRRVGINLTSQHFRSRSSGELEGQPNAFSVTINNITNAESRASSVTIHPDSGTGRQRQVLRRTVYLDVPETWKPAEDDEDQDDHEIDLTVVRTTVPDIDAHKITNHASVFSVNFYQRERPDWTGRNPEALRIRASGQLNGTVDNLNGIVEQLIPVKNEGELEYVVEASSNPAWIIRKFWLGYYAVNADGDDVLVAGRGYHTDTIDHDNLEAFARFCDLNGLTCNAHVDVSHMSENEIEEAILQCGWASYNALNGKHAVLWDRPNVPVTALFGVNNIVADSVRIQYNGEPLADTIDGTFIDEASDYEQSTIRRVVPNRQVEGKPVRITLQWITNMEHAAKELNRIAAAQYYHNRVISFQASLDAGHAFLARGDVIALGHNLLGGTISTRFANLAGTSFTYFQLEMPIGAESLRACLYLYDTDGVVRGPYYFLELRSDSNAEQLGFDASKVWGLLYADKSFSFVVRTDDILKDGLDGDTDLDRLKRYRIVIHDLNADLVKVRVTGIRPEQNNVYTVSCRDEIPEYYERLNSDLTGPFLPTRLRRRVRKRPLNDFIGTIASGIGVERIWTGTDRGVELLTADLPDNNWGFGEGGTTSSGQVWAVMPLSLTDVTKQVYQSERMVIGIPDPGDPVTDLWSEPVIITEAGESIFIAAIQELGSDKLVTFNDGTSVLLPAGQPAANIVSATRDPESGLVTLRYADGRTFSFSVVDGVDGRYREYIFRRTREPYPPTDAPDSPQVDDYVPEGYTDDPIPPDSEFLRVWVRTRRFNRETQEWGPWSAAAYHDAFIPEILGQVEYWMVGNQYPVGYLVGHTYSITVGGETISVIRAFESIIDHESSPSNEPPNPAFWRNPAAVAPSAIQNFTITQISALVVEWRWTPPVTGTRPLTYRVQYAANSTFTEGFVEWTTSQNSGSGNLNELLPNTTYYIRVRAENLRGIGPWVNETYDTPAVTGVNAAPGTPVDFAYSETPHRSLSWQPGAPAGAAPVVYRVQISTANDFSSALNEIPHITQHSVDIRPYVQDSTTYYARVKAVNNGGESAYTVPISFLTAGGLGINITNRALGEFLPPGGFNPHQGMRFDADGSVYVLMDDGNWHISSSTTDWLRPVNRPQDYEIMFVNQGASSLSSAFELAFGQWYPLSVSRYLARLNVPFGVPALDVQVTIREIANTSNSDIGVITFPITGSTSDDVLAAPATVTIRAPSPGDTRLSVLWSLVSGASAYSIQLSRDSDFETIAYEITLPPQFHTGIGLGPLDFGTYYARVRAIKGSGSSTILSDWTVAFATATLTPASTVTAPGLPTIAASRYDGGFTIAYTVPSSGGLPTGYRLHFREQGVSTWTDAGVVPYQGPTTTVSYPNNSIYYAGTTIQYRFRAENSVGQSAWSTIRSFVLIDSSNPEPVTPDPDPPTNQAPGIPTAITSNIQDTFIVIQIIQSSSGGTPAPDAYSIRGGTTAGGMSGWITVTGQSSVYMATGLSPATEYQFQVGANNQYGFSGWSGTYTITTLPS